MLVGTIVTLVLCVDAKAFVNFPVLFMLIINKISTVRICLARAGLTRVILGFNILLSPT